MKIKTQNYELEFPFRARKIRTKITPCTEQDFSSITHILNNANINFSIIDKKSETIGLSSSFEDLYKKLNFFVHEQTLARKNEKTIAKCLYNDVKLKVLLA